MRVSLLEVRMRSDPTPSVQPECVTDIIPDVLTISDLPIDILRAELARRQDGADRPACGSGKRGAYNTPIHVFALVLILALSTIGITPHVSRAIQRGDTDMEQHALSQ